MAPSWAKIVDPSDRVAPLPTPQQRLDALSSFYRTQSNKAIMMEALGAYPTVMPGTPAIAAPLVEHMITICVDTESSTHNTDLMTELGLNRLERSAARRVARNPGAHGERIMELLQFFHFRVVEHAHLLSNRENSLGPLGNRFGHTRFATFEELRVVLRSLFNQPVQSSDPALKGCMRPIVLVGHALRHDEENVKKEGLGYDFANNNTIVAKVDTQPLARDLGVWVPHPTMRSNEIGLRVLIEERAMFQHVDDHTACNDAARTMMCAVWMVLPASLKQNQARTMQDVANHIEAQSKTTSPSPYGTVECCTRCGDRSHSSDKCEASNLCAACNRFDAGPDRDQNCKSHIETYCPHVAKFKAWARRYKDAAAKHQASGRPFSVEVLQGPEPGTHPWSTWKGAWPFAQLSDVLRGMAFRNEPVPFVYNLQSALGGLPVPSTGSWQMAVTATGTPSSIPSASNSTASTLSTAFPPLPPASNHSSAPTAHHVVTMSEQRGRGRGIVRGSAHSRAVGSNSRGGPAWCSNSRGGRGSEHSRGGAASGFAPSSWDW